MCCEGDDLKNVVKFFGKEKCTPDKILVTPMYDVISIFQNGGRADSHIGFNVGNVRPPTKYNCQSQFGPQIILVSIRFIVLQILRFFSELELTFTFSICHRPFVCLSVVCNVRAPYSGD